MHSAEKKVTGNSIYTHSILYYFGRQDDEQFQYCKQLFTLMTLLFLPLFRSFCPVTSKTPKKLCF